MEVDSQDVQDTLSLRPYQAGTTLRISRPFEPLQRNHYSLFAVSRVFGWAAVVASSDANSASSLILTRLDDLQAAFDQAEDHSVSPFQPDQSRAIVIPTTSFCSSPGIFITHVAFASWDRLVVVATCDGSLHVFSLYALTNQNITTPMKSIPSAGLVPLKMLVPNPSRGGSLAGVIVAVYQNGTIAIFDAYQDLTYWTAQSVTVAEWSPMGKRLLVGYTDGRLEFVTHEGASKGKIEPPGLAKDQGLSVLHVKWLDQKNYLVTFIQPIDSPEALSETFCLNIPRQADPSTCTFSRVPDALTSDGATCLPPDILTLTLPVNPQTKWKHLTISSFTLSTTLTLLGYSTSDKPVSLVLGEDGRPEIPYAEEDFSSAATLGFGASYCASNKLPLIWCYTTDGVLASWKVELTNPSLEDANPSEVWNEISGYSDISSVEEKGMTGPPAAAAPIASSMDATVSARPQAGLLSSQSSAFGAPSLTSSQVTAFGKPSLGVAGTGSTTGFGTPSFLNQSSSSALAFGNTSLGASSSPFANLLSSSTSTTGFNSFASPSPLNQAAGTSSLAPSANTGFAAFSNPSGNAGFAAFSNASDKPGSAGFASFASSSGKTELGASDVFDQFNSKNTPPSFLDGSTAATKTSSIFDNPSNSQGPKTPNNNSSAAFGVTKPPSSAFGVLKPPSSNSNQAAFGPTKPPSPTSFASSSGKTAPGAATNVFEQLTSKNTLPNFLDGNTATASKTPNIFDDPPPNSEAPKTPGNTNQAAFGVTKPPSSSNQSAFGVPQLQSSSFFTPKTPIESSTQPIMSSASFGFGGRTLPNPMRPLPLASGAVFLPKTSANEANVNALPSPPFVAPPKVTAGRDPLPPPPVSAAPSFGGVASQAPAVNQPDPTTPAEAEPKASIDDRDTHSTPPPSVAPLKVVPALDTLTPKPPVSAASSSGGIASQAQAVTQLESITPAEPKESIEERDTHSTPPLSVAPPVMPALDATPPMPLVSACSSSGGIASQAPGATQPDSITPAKPLPKASIDERDTQGETQIDLSDLQQELSIASTLPDESVAVPKASAVESAFARLDFSTREHVINPDSQSGYELDTSSENDDALLENIEDALSDNVDNNLSDNGDDSLSDNADDALSDNDNDDDEPSQSDDEESLEGEDDEPPQIRAQTPLEPVASTSPKSFFGLTSSPPSKLKRSVTSNHEAPSQPAGTSTRVLIGSAGPVQAHSSGLAPQAATAPNSCPPHPRSSTTSLKTAPVQWQGSHASHGTSSQPPQKVLVTAPPSPPPFLVTRPEFIAPMSILSAETVPKIFVNTSPESFSKPDEGLDEALSRVIDSITSEIDCLKAVGLVCRRYLSECCKEQPPELVTARQGGAPNLFLGNINSVNERVQNLHVLAQQRILENEARFQAVTALDNAHIKADIKVEEIKRILRLRNDPGFSQVIRTRQLGPVQLAHQKDMRRLIRHVKHGISQMSEVIQSFESRHREASTRRNKIQPPSLDTINRCIRFITLGLTQHIINLEKLHLRVSQNKTKTLKDKKESLGVNSLSPENSSRDQTAALRALMSEHTGAILKESILKRGDEPILTRAQTSLPTDLSGEPSGLSHIRSSGIIIIRPRQRSQN